MIYSLSCKKCFYIEDHKNTLLDNEIEETGRLYMQLSHHLLPAHPNFYLEKAFLKLFTALRVMNARNFFSRFRKC